MQLSPPSPKVPCCIHIFEGREPGVKVNTIARIMSLVSTCSRKAWEEAFKEKSSVISVIEMVCCRKIVELIQVTVKVAYYYHHLHHPSAKSKQWSERKYCSA